MSYLEKKGAPANVVQRIEGCIVLNTYTSATFARIQDAIEIDRSIDGTYTVRRELLDRQGMRFYEITDPAECAMLERLIETLQDRTCRPFERDRRR